MWVGGPIYPSESVVTDEVVELAARWLVDIEKKNKNECRYLGRCGHCCTPGKCLQQRTTGCGTSTWLLIVSIHSSDNSRIVKLKSYLTSSPKLDLKKYYDVIFDPM